MLLGVALTETTGPNAGRFNGENDMANLQNRITDRITKIWLKSYHEKSRCKFLPYNDLCSGRYWT
jgi:hypothetical protein